MKRPGRMASGVVAVVTTSALVGGLALSAAASAEPSQARQTAATVEKATGTTDLAHTATTPGESAKAATPS
ncbi:hypothetical protein [Streptomyces venezuelae]|nr:hypothetical protein [Streptomyces venezuelae]